MSARTRAVMSEVEDERRRQDSKWGSIGEPRREHPMGGDPQSYVSYRDAFQHITYMKSKYGTVTWVDILLEEAFEFAAEPDDDWPRQRTELVQTAAVAIAAVEAGDLRAQKAKDAAGADTSESESSQLA